ncbi:Nickel uptake substrate-specific transmembrane region [Blastochloris viridis]|uniref:Nickel uptake substrate-specific transmembrane region n=1 Tax=Blastochloris viridis TaxID=1079 RepID=A0A0S4Q2N1_BLAVI|nr:Nickel uptake substrate-specific transmembrane region [Blastochloris viridis]
MKAALAATALATCAATPAKAHFQLVYTPEVNLEKAGEIPLLLAFWHPFANGHAMDMGKPLEFFVIHKGEKTDLLAKLSPISFRGAENAAAGFEAKVPVRRLGDYIFVLVPAPYLEKSEGKFIQQITKSFVNQGGVPGGWNEPVGLATEIVPLNKPTNILAGSTFSGVVLSEGKPVAGAEIEIEYLAAEPDIAARKPGKAKASPPPGGAVVAITDANGVFTFGLPKAGFWGFAALGSGSAKQHDGKPLSQDAVLWVRAYDVK